MKKEHGGLSGFDRAEAQEAPSQSRSCVPTPFERLCNSTSGPCTDLSLTQTEITVNLSDFLDECDFLDGCGVPSCLNLLRVCVTFAILPNHREKKHLRCMNASS